MENHENLKLLQIKLTNLKEFLTLGYEAEKLHLGHFSQKTYKDISPNPRSNFHK